MLMIKPRHERKRNTAGAQNPIVFNNGYGLLLNLWVPVPFPMMAINYAHETGIYSVAAAIVFVCIYAPFLARFVYMSFKRPVHVHFALVLFCTCMRIR